MGSEKKPQKAKAAPAKRDYKPKRVRKAPEAKWPMPLQVVGLVTCAVNREVYTFLKGAAASLGFQTTRGSSVQASIHHRGTMSMTDAVKEVNSWREKMGLPAVDPVGNAAVQAALRREQQLHAKQAEAARRLAANSAEKRAARQTNSRLAAATAALTAARS